MLGEEHQREDTTLSVKRATKRRLLRMKRYPRETEDELVRRATGALEDKGGAGAQAA